GCLRRFGFPLDRDILPRGIDAVRHGGLPLLLAVQRRGARREGDQVDVFGAFRHEGHRAARPFRFARRCLQVGRDRQGRVGHRWWRTGRLGRLDLRFWSGRGRRGNDLDRLDRRRRHEVGPLGGRRGLRGLRGGVGGGGDRFGPHHGRRLLGRRLFRRRLPRAALAFLFLARRGGRLGGVGGDQQGDAAQQSGGEQQGGRDRPG